MPLDAAPFDVEGLLAAGAAGKAPGGENVPALPAEPAPFDVESMLAAGIKGEFKHVPPPASPKASTWLGAAKNFAAGIPEGIASVADFVEGAMPGGLGGVGGSQKVAGAVQGKPPEPGLQEQAQGLLGVVPQGFGERLAHAAGVGLGASAMPGIGPGMALANTIGGGVGQAASELAPKGWEGPASLIGNVGGSMGALGAGLLAREGGRWLGRIGGGMGIGAKPLAEGGAPIVGSEGPIVATQTQMQRVGQKLTDAAGPDLEAAQTKLAGAPSPIEGFNRTLGQQTEIPGFVDLEGTYRRAYPAWFNRLGAQQAEAMQKGIAGLAPEGAVAATPGRQIADQMRAAEDAMTAAQGANGGVTGATEGLGGYTEPQAQGQALRGAVEAAREPAKAAASAPWEALQADPSLAVDLSPMRVAAKRIVDAASPTAAGVPGMADVTAHISRALQNQKVVTFQGLSDLMRDTSAVERSLRNNILIGNESPAMRAIQDFKGSLYDSIAHTIDLTNAREAAAVTAGTMAPEATLEQRFRDFFGRQTGQSGEEAGAVARVSPSTGPGAPSEPIGDVSGGAAGAGKPATGGPGSAAGNSRVEVGPTISPTMPSGKPAVFLSGPAPKKSPALQPNFPQEAADLYVNARPAYAKYKTMYRTGPVGEVLQPGPAPGTFRLTDADAVRKFFSGGARQPEDVQKLIAAVGSPEGVAPLAREVLAWQLRDKGIIGLDGTINAQRFSGWQQRQAPTLKLFPGLADEFSTAAKAQEAYDASVAATRATKEAFEKGAARHFLGKDPEQSVKSAIQAGPQAFREINTLLRGNDAAMNGWKAAVTDYIVQRFRSARPASEEVDFLKSGEFRKFVAQNRDSLKTVFGGQGTNLLENVGEELRRQAYRAEASSGSPTTQYLIGAKKEGLMPGGHGGNTTVMALIGEHLGEHLAGGAAAAGAGLAHTVAPVAGAVAVAGGAKGLNFLKQRGIDRMNALAREAILNPQLGRLLMEKVKPNTELTPALSRRIAAALVAAEAGQPEAKP